VKLDVNGAAIDDAKPEDIKRAIEARAGDAALVIMLSRGDDAFLQAHAQPGGLFALICLEKGKQKNGKAPLTEAKARNVLVSYLAGDDSWRHEIASRVNPSGSDDELTFAVAAVDQLSRKLAGESDDTPPGAMSPVTASAIAAVVFACIAAFVGLTHFASDLSRLPWPLGAIWAQMFAVIAGAIVAISLILGDSRASGASGRKLAEDRRAHCKIRNGVAAAKVVAPANGAAPRSGRRNEYFVGGQKRIGDRLAIGSAAAGEGVAAMLAHYPVGAEVEVFYDPDRPANSLLRRDAPQTSPRGCLAILVGVYVVAGAFAALFVSGPEWVLGRFPAARHPLAAAIFGLLALLLIVLFFALRRTQALAGGWPTAKGVIVVSRLKEAITATDRGARTRRGHIPDVEYTYDVNGRPYRGAQIKLRMVTMGAKAGDSALARYPKGAIVEVHYNPKNPADAALERDTLGTYVVLPAAIICLLIALFAAGAL
jgi:Protein of unknown function (DUF3592)